MTDYAVIKVDLDTVAKKLIDWEAALQKRRKKQVMGDIIRLMVSKEAYKKADIDVDQELNSINSDPWFKCDRLSIPELVKTISEKAGCNVTIYGPKYAENAIPKSKVSITIKRSIKRDRKSQDIIRTEIKKGSKSRAIAKLVGYSKTAVNNWIATQPDLRI